MFKKIRRPGRSHKEGSVKKIFFYFVFGLICAVFLFIAPMGSQFMGESQVAKVGRERIMIKELRDLEENLKQDYQKQGQVEEWDEATLNNIRSTALGQLIDIYSIYISSKKEGFFLSDQELRDSIQSFPEFQEKGRFLYSRYLEFLKFRKISPKSFEEKIRKAQTAQNWSELFDKAFQTTDLEKQQNKKRNQYTIRLEYAEIQAEELKEDEIFKLLKDKNKKSLELLLKKAGVSWQKTEDFSLFLPVRTFIAQNPKIMSAIIGYLPKTGLIPSLIRDNNKIYIVNILSFSKKSAESEKENQLEMLLSQNFGKSNELFEAWLKAQKEQIRIKKNPKF